MASDSTLSNLETLLERSRTVGRYGEMVELLRRRAGAEDPRFIDCFPGAIDGELVQWVSFSVRVDGEEIFVAAERECWIVLARGSAAELRDAIRSVS